MSSYQRGEFSFVHDEGVGEDDVADWLSFTNTRSGRRQERRELLRGRRRLVGVGLVFALVVVGLLAWSPWSAVPDPDTGEAFLGADRTTVLVGVQGNDGTALLCGLLVHDRVQQRGSVVVVPTDLMLPVTGEGRLAISDVLDRAGPTLTREALGDALGVRTDGSWVLPDEEFARFVDRLGGVDVAVDRAVVRDGRTIVPSGGQRLDGARAIAYAAYLASGEKQSARSRRAQQVLSAVASATPQTFTGARDLLDGLGVLGEAGLPVDRLAAILSGAARDAAGQRLDVGRLPVDPDGHGLDVSGAATLVRDLLGGRPRTVLADVAPRVMVQLSVPDPQLAAEVRASLVGAGYEYVDGGRARTRPKDSVVAVRADDSGAGPVGEAVALTLGLDRSAVTSSPDVPVVADVLVILGSEYGT